MYDKQDEEKSGIAPSPSGNPARITPSAPLPTGTVTFLFTDIEGSTRLWEHDPQSMEHAFSRQEQIVREAMAAAGGYVYKMIGDAFQVAFSTASDALRAAVAAQRALDAESWGQIGVLKVRMALHTCLTEERGDDYVGPELNRVARLLSAGHGGQILLSQATADLVRDHLPEGISLRDMGEHALKDLIRPERIYQVVAPELPDFFPALRTQEARLFNLPIPATSFVGREAELVQIEILLQEPRCRLISLVGPGGSGKTRLAIQAATQSVESSRPQVWPHGVSFVGLAAVASPEEVMTALADALQMPFYVQPGTSLSLQAAQAQLLAYLADKEALLVLDNCEHLAAGQFTEFVAELLAAAPRAKLIVTSRERLNLPGEWVIEVTGLAFPYDDAGKDISEYAAVQLFLQGARRSGSFDPDAADWFAIGRTCQLLGGMPLGVEMAAAWTKVLSCPEIAAELERDLLALIATWRTVPERHRTLRVVVDHSWRLLSNDERDAFSRLSVFRGGFHREAATEVAGVSLALLGALIDKSLLRRASGSRFEMHPVLRQYAAEKLAADRAAYAEARSGHARYYSQWLGGMNEKLKSGDPLAALAALRVETQNLHDAWRWLIEQRDVECLHGMLPAMILYHEMRGRPVGAEEVVGLLREMVSVLRRDPIAGAGLAGRASLEAASSAGSADASLLALVLAALRHFSQALRDDRDEASSYQQESLAIAQRLLEGVPDQVLAEKALTLMLDSMGGGLLTSQQSIELCQQCAGIFARLGDAWGVALAQLVLADAAIFGAVDVDAELARQSYLASLEGFTGLDNAWGQALCLTGLTEVERRAGHLAEAYRLGCQGLDMYCQMEDAWRAVFTRKILGEVAEELGRFDEAGRHFEDNLAHFSRMGDGPGQDYYRARLEHLDECARTVASDLAREVKEGETSAPTNQPPALNEAFVEPLSAREIEVLCLLAEGLTNREIALRLYLSPNTVRVHTFHIYGKLGVNNRTQAVARARALGLLASE